MEKKKRLRHPCVNVFIFLAHLPNGCEQKFGGKWGDGTPLPLLLNGSFTHLVQLNPLLGSLGFGVGDLQGSELGSEQVGEVLLQGGNIEAEQPGGDSPCAGLEVVCRLSGDKDSTVTKIGHTAVTGKELIVIYHWNPQLLSVSI